MLVCGDRAGMRGRFFCVRFGVKNVQKLIKMQKKCKKMQKNEKNRKKICIYQKFVVILHRLSKMRERGNPKK